RTVLACAPAFVGYAADVACLGDLPPRLVRGDVLRRVEMREVLAEDLRGGIPADALGAAVPAADEAVSVEHEDRIVVDAFDEQPKAFLALRERLLLAAPFAQIARDVREADELAARIAQRGDHDVGPEARAVLADAPAFVLETAFHARDAELVLRPRGLDRLRRIEARQMRADDLVGFVARDLTGTGIPRRDEPFGVQHEDRVVVDVLD